MVSPFSRIYLIDDGEAIVRYSGKEFRLTPGMLHLIPCHVHFELSCPAIHCQFHVGFIARLVTGVDLFDLYRCEPILQASADDYKTFKRLCALYEPASDPFGRLSQALPVSETVEARGLLMQLMVRFLRTASEPEPEDGRFSPVLTYIDENLHRDITLQNLADLIGLVPTYFSDLFHKTVGVRPMELLNRRRIERAQLLLASTNLPIQEVADQVGVRSPEYFSRLFRRFSGVSPRHYRRLLFEI